MNQSLKTAVFFVVIAVTLYLFFFVVIGRYVLALNASREEELRAVTEEQELLRRVPAQRQRRSLPRPPETGFALPLPAFTAPVSGEPWPSPAGKGGGAFMSVATPHFTLYSYNRALLEFVGARIEKYYDGIVRDTGLPEAGAPSGSIPVYIFADKDEYLRRTEQPAWSDGCAAVQEGGVSTYDGPHLRVTLPHELTHLLLNRFLGDRSAGPDLRWVSEGLAVYEAMQAEPAYARAVRLFLKENFRSSGIPLAHLPSENIGRHAPGRRAQLWYAETGALMDFLAHGQGQDRFVVFCRALQDYGDAAEAFRHAYAGTFSVLEDAEAAFADYVRKGP